MRGARRSGGTFRAALATDDITLVERVRTGDQRAFKLLVERYQRKIYSVALGMLKDKEEARDVAQEAFVKVYRYIDHFKGDASFYTWLYRITVNICIDVMRKKGSTSGREAVEFDESVKMDMAEANIGAVGSERRMAAVRRPANHTDLSAGPTNGNLHTISSSRASAANASGAGARTTPRRCSP